MAGSCTARWCSSTSRGRPGIARWRRRQGPTGLEPGHNEYGNDVDFCDSGVKINSDDDTKGSHRPCWLLSDQIDNLLYCSLLALYIDHLCTPRLQSLTLQCVSPI